MEFKTLGRTIILACAVTLCTGASPNPGKDLKIGLISGRPDMVTGGDALVRIEGRTLREARVTLNGRDVSTGFRSRPGDDALIGRVTGLAVGGNLIEVERGADRAQLRLTNYPTSGPIFSGPHQKPFICQTDTAGLGPALDENCAARTIVKYHYKSTDPIASERPGDRQPQRGLFKPYDPSASRPADMARTTTIDGRILDYIVRREIGVINRSLYNIAFLHQPGQPLPDPWNGTEGWNGKLVYSFGGGCGAGYRQGRLPTALEDSFLSLGFASVAASLNVLGNNCNTVLSAETMMMVKEHFIEQFGPPVQTIGWGGSGGALQQYLIAQNYPGLLDGITPLAANVDVPTVVPGVVDCTLLDRAFAASGQQWADAQKAAVSGFATWQTCASWIRFEFSPRWLDPKFCDPVIPKALVYDASTNRGGARCTVQDNVVNLLGRESATDFARRTLDNVGVQYGLVAFNAGLISAEQFVRLNELAGGYDIDGNPVSRRSVGDPVAIRRAYRQGQLMLGTGGLPDVPIIDWRPYLDPSGDVHDSFRGHLARNRIATANGSADNHVLLMMFDAPGADLTAIDSSIARLRTPVLRWMNQWLDNIARDRSAAGRAVKVARNRPADLIDTCWNPAGERIAGAGVYESGGRCARIYPAHGDPRVAAGGPVANNILKCSLQPIVARGYARPLTVAQLARLRTAFPSGVCDYRKPGFGMGKLQGTWLRY